MKCLWSLLNDDIASIVVIEMFEDVWNVLVEVSSQFLACVSNVSIDNFLTNVVKV